MWMVAITTLRKGIFSYKLSASHDPKLHAESHSHFGRKDVMLQWLFASWKIGLVDWTWSLVWPNQNGEKDRHFHVDEEQITKWVAREPPASHLQIRRPLIYKVRKRKWQNYNLKTLDSTWVQMCPVTAKQSSSLEDTCLLALDQSAVCHCSCVPWIKLQDLSQCVLLHFSRPSLLEALWQHPHAGSFLPLQLYQFTSYWESKKTVHQKTTPLSDTMCTTMLKWREKGSLQLERKGRLRRINIHR